MLNDALIGGLGQALAQQTRQSPESITDEQIVTAALLEALFVDDCIVLSRETASCDQELVAYVVSSKPLSVERFTIPLASQSACCLAAERLCPNIHRAAHSHRAGG